MGVIDTPRAAVSQPREEPYEDLATRSRRVVASSQQRARRAAAIGDYGDALGWLELVSALDGRLSEEWEQRRRRWERGLPEREG